MHFGRRLDSERGPFIDRQLSESLARHTPLDISHTTGACAKMAITPRRAEPICRRRYLAQGSTSSDASLCVPRRPGGCFPPSRRPARIHLRPLSECERESEPPSSPLARPPCHLPRRARSKTRPGWARRRAFLSSELWLRLLLADRVITCRRARTGANQRWATLTLQALLRSLVSCLPGCASGCAQGLRRTRRCRSMMLRTVSATRLAREHFA
jgi:hypothetical protein